jgi:hypothetical protein
MQKLIAHACGGQGLTCFTSTISSDNAVSSLFETVYSTKRLFFHIVFATTAGSHAITELSYNLEASICAPFVYDIVFVISWQA